RHVEDEVGDALVLGDVGIRAGEQQAELRVLRRGVPHLLTGDHELVAVALGSCRERGEVAARARLAEQLAPELVATEEWPEVALLLLGGAVRHDRRPGEGLRRGDEPGGGVELRQLLVEDDLLRRGAAATTERLRPGDPRPAVVEQRALPLLAA